MRELKKNKSLINPDLTPLIDVVFQLLIFFMLVTTFSQYTKFDMNLPKSSVEQIDMLEEGAELIIDKEGKYFFKNGEDSVEIPNENLEETVKELMTGRSEQTLIVSADKDLRYEVVIETMGRLKNIGIEKLEINSIK